MFLHACRALAVCAVITGFFGGVLTLIGMKCTKIGGSEIANSRVTFAGSVTYLVSGKTYLKYFHIVSVLYVIFLSPSPGFCGMITYSWWANRVISIFVDPNFRTHK